MSLKHNKSFGCILVMASIYGGTTQAYENTSNPTANAVAIVNGQYIDKSELASLEKEIAERSKGQQFLKEKLIEELVQRELLVQDATQKQLDKSPELLEQLETAKKALLTQADLQNFIKANPVTEAEIKAEYDRQDTLKKESKILSLEAVKDQLPKKKVQDMIETLRKQAKIEVLPTQGDHVAIVNGQYIDKSKLTALEKDIAERSKGQQQFPKEKLVQELIERELLAQDATQKQLDKSPELIAQLDSAKGALVIQAVLQNFNKANPVSEAEIKSEYDSRIAAEKGVEFKARHILVNTEAEAKKLITELDKGADFSKLANQNSLDAKESQNGGDLGWFSAGQMVAPFSEAVAVLENGKYTKEPVKTQFGFHLILREDSRVLTPPSLDSVKGQLAPLLQRKKVQDMIEKLRKQAKIEILI